jgi:hypothetical protein
VAQLPAAAAALQIVFFIVGNSSGSSNSGTWPTGILKFDELEQLQLHALQHELWLSHKRGSHYNLMRMAINTMRDGIPGYSIRLATSAVLRAGRKAQGVELAELRF